VDPAEGLQDPCFTLVVADLAVQLPCPLKVADCVLEASAEVVHVGGREQVLGFAPALADLLMNRAGLLG
jgi:hypothetical protein